jgi:hypothetical protein
LSVGLSVSISAFAGSAVRLGDIFSLRPYGLTQSMMVSSAEGHDKIVTGDRPGPSLLGPCGKIGFSTTTDYGPLVGGSSRNSDIVTDYALIKPHPGADFNPLPEDRVCHHRSRVDPASLIDH